MKRIGRGSISCYRDAVIAAYYLAATEPMLPRSDRRAFSDLAAPPREFWLTRSVAYLLRLSPQIS